METDQSVSPLNLGEHKATEGMRGSLSRLLNLLRCPLCNQANDWWKTASHDYVLKPPPTINEESITSGMDGKVDADCSDDEDMIDLQGSPSLLHDSISDDDD
eukprot:scaffold22641_cov206-Cylindrotheca_fusiformis.AAC.13